MNNLENLKNGYQDFATGNMEGVVSLWQQDIEWRTGTAMPYINADGIYKGAEAIVGGVFAHIPAYFNNFNIEISDFIDAGDKIVMVGYYTGTWKATGKEFKANAVNVWTFKNGKVSHFFEAADTAAIMNP
jgi:ketosteroid isomerase-like protein